MAGPSVMDALRRFLPRFLASRPGLSAAQWRAVHAISQCRTPALGGHVHACPDCDRLHFAWHSCNHKACPQCGRAATQAWVERQLGKLTGAPYFMVTFTLPGELRDLFFGPVPKEAFDLFFAAASRSLADKLASQKGLKAHVSGFTAVLHTWNQQLLFHPHLHCIVPGAGLRTDGKICRVKQTDYLVHIPTLRRAFKAAVRRELDHRQWEVDPAVWHKDWGVHIQPCGTGTAAIKYLGAYVARTAIGDSRIVNIDDDHVTFLWKDRANGGRVQPLKLDGVEFVRRYLRHVMPPKMHSVRHYGFCHPAAKKNRERVRFLTGMTLVIDGNPQPSADKPAKPGWPCPCCGAAMLFVAVCPRRYDRGPPPRPPPNSS
jgi:hypothetical protein